MTGIEVRTTTEPHLDVSNPQQLYYLFNYLYVSNVETK